MYVYVFIRTHTYTVEIDTVWIGLDINYLHCFAHRFVFRISRPTWAQVCARCDYTYINTYNICMYIYIYIYI